MGKKKKLVGKNDADYFDDYLEIMKKSNGDFVSVTEWKNEGDYFKKLSIYEEYTPVTTSNNTGITK